MFIKWGVMIAHIVLNHVAGIMIIFDENGAHMVDKTLGLD